MSPRRAGALAVAGALVASAAWFARLRAPQVETITDATVAVHIRRHDAFGVPSSPIIVRDRTRLRALLASLALDTQPALPCPPDYATAEVGLLLTGRDVYARRNAYVWDLTSAPHVIVVDSTGCRGGAVPDPAALRDTLGAVDAGSL